MVLVRTGFAKEGVEPTVRGGGCLDEVPVLELAALLGGGGALSLMLFTQVEIDSQYTSIFLEGGGLGAAVVTGHFVITLFNWRDLVSYLT